MAGDVWSFPVLAGRRFRDEKVDHPTQKPLNLSSRIVQHFSNPGELVLVPFAGSGSEVLAARMAGRHFIAFDLNPDYVEIALGRLRAWDEEGLAPGAAPEVIEASTSPLRRGNGQLPLD